MTATVMLSPQGLLCIPLAEREVFGRLVRRRRKTIGLYLLRDGSVEVRVPLDCPEAVALRFLSDQLDWLERKLGERSVPGTGSAYCDGASHPFLGVDRVLEVQQRARTGVICQQDRLQVFTLDTSPAVVADLLTTWYRREALVRFPQRLEHWWGMPAFRGLTRPELRVRRMRSRWGSCSRSGRINLNLWLLRAPLACVDHVIVHELCHLREFHHGPAFHALVATVLPDWRSRRALLNEHSRRHGVAPPDP